MTSDESRLAALLEGSGDAVEVGPAPYDALWEGARRVRRTRQRRVFAGAVASVALAVGVTTALGLPGGDDPLRDPALALGPYGDLPPQVAAAAEDSLQREAEVAASLDLPADTELVGFDGLAVAVPQGWSRDVPTGCGTPDAVVALSDGGDVCRASVNVLSSRSTVATLDPGDEDVEELAGDPAADDALSGLPSDRVTLDGAEFATTGVLCADDGSAVATATCEVSVTALDRGVTLRLRSSAEPAEARRELEDLLDGVRVLDDDLTAVPVGPGAPVLGLTGASGGDVARPESLQDSAEGSVDLYSGYLAEGEAAALAEGAPMPRGGYSPSVGATSYVAQLRAAGLVPRVVEERAVPAAGGELIGTVPAPGAVLPRGTEVVLRVAAAPTTPAEAVRTEATYARPDGGSATVDDAALRAGATVRVRVGGTVAVSGYDVRGYARANLGGEVDGSAVRGVDDARVATWRAVARGTSTITVTREVGGYSSVVGTLRVEVVG
ncbi:PASTA domain-containing protein [Nocardioides alkalitolerans]|uniref:PASTA domain-containing protein n=1 Tax=Nocardioides alkalitolerans TaxID=281714 RepID=UPI00040A2AB3|nr:PASTA domain-containing protein [Nocardioides alkalitolerans]